MRPNKPGSPRPGPILELIMAFYGSRALISAIELDVFSTLAAGPMTADDLSTTVGLHSRGAADFLDALVSLGILNRDGGLYSNSEQADLYLNRERPGYVGGYAHLADKMLLPVWSKLTDALRTGQAQVPSNEGIFDGYRDENATRGFLGAMDAVNSGVATNLAKQFNWRKYSSFVDLGGARGNLAMTLVREHPHLDAVCFDLPPVKRFFIEHVDGLGMSDQVRFVAGDFFADPLPAADVFIAGHVLHYYDLPRRQVLLRRVFEALNQGGALLVYDRMIDSERRTKSLSLLGSLNMLLTSAGGREYTPDECQSWLTDAGFGRTEVRDIDPPDTLVVGYKD